MALRTVKVPKSMSALFERAEEVVSSYFARRRDDPERGTIEIFDQRYVLVRAASLSVEFFGVVRDLLGEGREADADDFSRNILYDLAHAMGKSDARNFHEKMGLEEAIARLSAGPVHFAHAGWAHVEISPLSRPLAGADYYLLYDHPYSFESDAWLRAGKHSDLPVCIMNSGYSSGWCEESFGLRLAASEILCRAKGDECCRFIMAPRDRLEEHIRDYAESVRDGTQPVGVHVIPDLFARKRLEDELREARDNLEHRVAERTEELLAANTRLQEEVTGRAHAERMLLQSQKLEALGRLAGGIAHDFNNLLSAMGGYTELLQRELTPGSEVAGFADEIAESIARAAGLTQQLLVFSRQRVATPRVVDVSNVVRRLHGMLSRLIGEDVQLVTSLCEGPCCVEIDPTQLEQVVINLAVNARDAMPHGGVLTIAVECTVTPSSTSVPEGAKVRLCVDDTGTGMDESALTHIFDPFYTTKKPGEGTGLGLAMVHGTVTRYHGSVQVSSELGVGTRFVIELPKVAAGFETAEPRRPPAPEQIRSRRVLVVEDDAAVRGVIVRMLGDVGHELHVASGGEEALRIWHEHAGRIDAVLSDVIMPSMSGPALVEILRRDRPELPVLFVSGYAADRVDESALSDRRTAFLQKPFEMHVLVARLEQLFAEPGEPAAAGPD